jgi:hypothetical protein
MPEHPEDILALIFRRQNELVVKYKDIEGLPNYPMVVHTRESQVVIKDFLWRITEELCEALELLDRKDDPEIGPLFIEELSDALHFMVELCILVGIDSNNIEHRLTEVMRGHAGPDANPTMGLPGFFTWLDNVERMDFTSGVMGTVYQLGLAGNCLKNKPWKQTDMLTDEEKFNHKIFCAFTELVRLIHGLGMNIQGLYLIYYRKSIVNQFRQETKY